MFIKVSTKRQVTFPAKVLEALGVFPGDQLELVASSKGYLLRPRRVDRSKLGTLRDVIRKDVASFDLEAFRNQQYEPTLRD